jgi:hypothetical protein
MLTKPHTVCGCQPVAATISANVAPLARFISAMTSFSCWRVSLPLSGLLCAGFFGDLAFFAAARLGFGSGASVAALFSESIVLVLILFLLTGLRSRLFITPVGKDIKANLK